MAYFNLLAAVPEAQVELLRLDHTKILKPSLVLGASHLLASWVKLQPLAGLLREALDGGEIIHAELWHPLRPPLFHPPLKVKELSEQVDSAWQAALAGEPLLDDDWLRVEVNRMLRLYRFAASRGECVVSVLDSPADIERANRVRLLWEPF